MNSLLLCTLVAASRATWLPRLTGARVCGVRPGRAARERSGSGGAATGIVVAEWLLLLLAARACRGRRVRGRSRPAARVGARATLPMALAVIPVRDELWLALPLGAAVQLLATAGARKIASGRKRAGDLRYP